MGNRTTSSEGASRRQFLRLIGLGAAASLVAACGGTSQPSQSASPAAKSPAASGDAAAKSPAASASQPAASAKPNFPTKPVEILVPYPPGGGFDAVARQLAVPMQQELGQPVVVKNVSGGGGRIGARQFQQAAADGHMLGYFADNGLYVSQLVEPPEGFDLNTWVWAVGIRFAPPGVYVGRNSPFKTLEDVLAADRNGQRLRFSHNGLGAAYLPLQIAFASLAGLKNPVYIGGFQGTADMVPAVVRGDIDVQIFAPVASVHKFTESGDIRPLAVLEKKRIPILPNVPTVNELNVPNADQLNVLGSTYGFAVAPGTPEDRVRILEQAVLKALKDPTFLDWAKKSDVEQDLLPLSGKELAEAKKKEYEVYRKFEAEYKKHAS